MSNNTEAQQSLKEMRNSLEIDIMALLQWLNRENSEPVRAALETRINAAQNALNAVTSDKRLAILNILDNATQYNDNVLVAALIDCKNWNTDLQNDWGTMDQRINHALDLYRGEGK